MGDGVLVYFGYPEAHEDDAERAVRAGLAIIDAVGALDLSQLVDTYNYSTLNQGIAITGTDLSHGTLQYSTDDGVVWHNVGSVCSSSALLLADKGIDQSATSFLPLGGEAAANALRTGELDAAFFVISPRAPVIRQALAIPGIRLLSIRRAPAYALQHRFFSVLTLPEGALDLRLNLPTHQTRLLAPATTLVVRQGFHPDVAALLLSISQRIFGEPGMFEQAGEFPSPKFLEFPISDGAKRFFHSGPPLLQRYLPFWAADLVDRLKIILLPLITLIYPLFRLVPSTYDWRMRSRINRWYKNLQAIEEEVETRNPKADVSSTLEELDRLEANVGRLSVPLAYANPLYTLRSHIALLRDELRHGQSAPPGSTGEQGSSKAA